MIELIRDYFTGIIYSSNPDLKFDGYVFETEKTGMSGLENTYKLTIGAMTTEKIDTGLSSVVPVLVTIYAHSTIDFVKFFDQTYNDAICIQASACNVENILQDSYIKGVTSSGITPSAIDGDDNFMKFDINFSVSVYYIHTT